MNVQHSQMDSMMKSNDHLKNKLLCENIWDIKLRGITVKKGKPEESGYLGIDNLLEFLQLNQTSSNPEHPIEIEDEKANENLSIKEDKEQEEVELVITKKTPEELEAIRKKNIETLNMANKQAASSVQYDSMKVM